MRDFLDLAMHSYRASGELKGTVSSRKVIYGPVMSTRLGLEVVVGLCLLELWLVENLWLAFLEGQ